MSTPEDGFEGLQTRGDPGPSFLVWAQGGGGGGGLRRSPPLCDDSTVEERPNITPQRHLPPAPPPHTQQGQGCSERGMSMCI